MRDAWRPFAPPLHPLARAAVMRAHALAVAGSPRAVRHAPRVLAAIPPHALPVVERVRLACALENLASFGAQYSLNPRVSVTLAARDLLAECARLGEIAERFARTRAALEFPAGNR